MAAPVIQSASVKTVEISTATASIASIPLSVSGTDRILMMVCTSAGNNATAVTVTNVVVDSAGVNSTLGNGKVVRQGSVQVAKEGNDYIIIDTFFCLESNLPSSAGNYKLDFTMSSVIASHMWIAFEITGCPKQAYDNIIQSVVLTDVNAGVNITNTLTPNDPDCLLVNILSVMAEIFSVVTSTETLVGTNISASGLDEAAISQFTQSGAAAAKTMTMQNSDTTLRHAKTLLSFSGLAASGSTFKPYYTNGYNNLI